MDTQLVTKQLHLEQWTRMVMSCKNSGLPVSEWCRQNNIGTKCYYYRYKKVKEAALQASAFAEIPVPESRPVFTEPGIQKTEPVAGDCGFIPQMTISVNGSVLGISESTPDSLILKMLELIKNA